MSIRTATKRLAGKRSADLRVPIVGERVKTALDAAGYSEKQAARTLADRKLARISQPALNNICTGKAKTCRRSVRDGIAALCGSPVTSEWLGGEKALEDGLFGPDWRERGLRPVSSKNLRFVMLASSVERAWARDRLGEESEFLHVFPALGVLLNLAHMRAVAASRLGMPLGMPASEEQASEFATHISRALYILLEPWLEGDQPADGPALLRAAGWLEREALKVFEQMKPELESKRTGQRTTEGHKPTERNG